MRRFTDNAEGTLLLAGCQKTDHFATIRMFFLKYTNCIAILKALPRQNSRLHLFRT